MSKWISAVAAIALTGCFQVTAELGHDDAGTGGGSGGGSGGAGGGTGGGAGGGLGGGASGGSGGGGGVDAGCALIDFLFGNAISMGSSPVAVVAADVNGDAKPDLVVATLGGQLVIALANGPGTFAVPRIESLSSLGFSAMATADFNGDGKLDVALGDYSGNVTLLLNDGSGVFTRSSSTGTNGTLFNLAAGELNGDSRADFVAGINAGTGSGVVVGFGNGDGGVTSSSPQPVDPPSNLEVADVDGDGNPDVIASSSGSGAEIAVLRGNGNGTFKAVQHSSVGFTVAKVHVGDFDRDGKLDAVVTGFQGQGGVLMRGKGDGTFFAAQSLPGMVSGVVISPDLNHDGKIDLIYAAGSGFGAMLGDGDGGFTDLGNFGGVGEARDVGAADFNSDGLLDLAIVDYQNSKVQLIQTHCK